MLRAYDVVLDEGSFRVLLTPKERVVTVLDVPSSALGALHIPVQVDRAPRLSPDVSPAVLREPLYSSQAPHMRRAVSEASIRTFDAMRGVSVAVAPPALRITRDAASEAADRLVGMRRDHEQAARLVARAHLGDVHARGFLHKIAREARAGLRSARHVANALLEVPKFTAKVLDVPVLVASHIKGAGGIARALSPLEHFEHMIDSVQRGDIKGLERMVKTDLSMMQGVASLIPGIGTGFSAAVGAGLAALEGGHPLAVAIKMAYGAIPIPVGIRQITDIVLDAVIALIEHPHNLSDVVIQVARERVPSGLPRQVFDTLVHVVLKHVPIKKELMAVAGHVLNQYAGGLLAPIANDAGHAVAGLLGPSVTGAVKALGAASPSLQHAVLGAAHLEGIVGGGGAR